MKPAELEMPVLWAEKPLQNAGNGDLVWLLQCQSPPGNRYIKSDLTHTATHPYPHLSL